MKQRVFALLLALALLASLLPQTALSASAEETIGGQCGESLRWTLDAGTGALTITGSGAMYDWTAPENVPWYEHRALIRSVSLPEGLTGIGSYAFADCTSLTSVTIPDGAGYAVANGASLPKRGVPALPASDGPVTVTAGMMVADSYDGLSEAERALLYSDYVVGPSFTFRVPNADDGLIEVDAELRKISAKPFADGIYTWEPTSAAVVWDGGSETVALTNGAGSFEHTGNAYHAQVTYTLDIGLDAELQRTLLNGPYHLATGLRNLEDFYFLDGSFTTIASNIMPMKQMADGIPFGESTITLSDEETRNAIWRLCDQYTRNGKFDISFRIAEYDAAVLDESQSVVRYLLTEGEDFRQTGVQVYRDLKQIANDVGVETIIRFLPSSDATKARIAFRSMGTVAQELERAANDDWAVLTDSPLKSGLSDADWLALDLLVNGVTAEAPHDNGLVYPVRAGRVTIDQNVNQHDLTVIVSAERVAPSTVDSAALTPLEPRTRTLHLPDGATRAELQQAIEDCGIEAAALAAWAIITPEHYERSVSALPEALTEDVTYTVSYAPKTCAISSDFGLPASVPYGYNLTLPLHGGTDLVYDYEIDGRSYREGTVYTVRGDVTIRRAENKPWTVVYINQLAADCYESELTAQEAAVLRAEALDSDYLLLRRPEAEDALVSVGFGGAGYRVTAQSYPSGVQGLTWTPVSGRAYDGAGQELAAWSFDGNTADFAAQSPAVRVEVDYRLEVTTVTEEQLLTLLRLPAVLAAEAKEQKRIIEIPNSVYGSLGELNRGMLNRINLAVKGSEMSEKSKAAVQRILDVCVNEETSRLYVYDFLTEYRRSGLLHYYRDENHVMFRAQIRVLNDNLSQIYNDPGFLLLLQELDYADKYEKIGTIIEKLGSTYIQPPNAAILLNDPALPELVRRIEAADGKTAAHTAAAEPLHLAQTLSADAPTEAPVKLTAQLFSGAGELLGAESETVLLPAMQPLTAQDIARLETALTALAARLGADPALYETADTLAFHAGDRLTDAAQQTFTYAPKRFAVRFTELGAEVGTASVPYDVPVVKLPACPELLKLYKYTLFSETVVVGSEPKTYTLTAEQLASLGDEPLTVTRETLTYALAACVGVGTDAFRGCTALTSVTVLDPRCEIADTATTLGAAGVTTIYGYPDSTAQAYAQKYGYTFVPMVTEAAAQGYEGDYDGAAHTAQVSVTGPMSFTLYYSTEQALNASNYASAGSVTVPARTDAGKSTVYYYVRDAVGYYGDCAGFTEILIRPTVTAEPFRAVFDGKPHSAAVTAEGGATLYYSTSGPLTLATYAANGSKIAPTRTEEGTTQVWFLAVPDRDATADACVSGETEIAVLAHTHSYAYRVTAAPTAEAEGTLTAACGVCGEVLTVALPALNETDYDYTVRSAPSCLADGTARYTWKTVSYGVYTFDETLPALGHNYVNGVCTRCGARQESLLYKGDLEQAVAEAEGIDLAPYTDESAAALTAAIAAARQTLQTAVAQQELDDAEAALYAAIRALTPKKPAQTLDKTALEAAISAAEKLDRESYTAESLAALDAALAAARSALTNATTQQALDEAEAALDAAILALEHKPETPPPPLNRDALRDAIRAAENIQKSDYTLESVAALETALADAKNVMQNASVQAELDKAEAVLTAAIRALTPKIPLDRSALEAAISAAEKLDRGEYTDESLAALDAALAAAKTALTDAATQQELDAAAAALTAAMGALKPSFRFSDVTNKKKFYYTAVYWAYNHKPYQITNGVTATTFEPDTGCTRAQVVTFLWRAAGQPRPTLTSNPFKDVPKGKYYTDAVLWAVEKEITSGTTKNTFSPNETCTRGQIVTFLYRFKGKPKASGSNPFVDVKKGAFYYDAVLWAVGANVTSGMDPTHFDPTGTCTRGQIVTFLHRAMGE